MGVLGVSAPGFASALGGVCSQQEAVCSWRGGLLRVVGVFSRRGVYPACTEADPPVNRMTDRCKNIAFANFVCGR